MMVLLGHNRDIGEVVETEDKEGEVLGYNRLLDDSRQWDHNGEEGMQELQLVVLGRRDSVVHERRRRCYLPAE